MLNATQLAGSLGVSKARVSQYVSEGKLDGCYEGEGRSRRFDLSKVQAALQGRLDPGQMMGNGAATKRALSDLADPSDVPSDLRPRATPKTDGALSPRDPDRYELARIQNAEEDARRKRRDNERDEGRWVLAEEVERSTAKLLSREIGQFETVIRDGARAIADRMGVDFREARQILMQVWRAHRGDRAEVLAGESAEAPMTAAEQEANG
jgi:hypothetical protein